MKRRTFLQSGLAAVMGTPLLAALRNDRLEDAAAVLASATSSGQVTSAVLHVLRGETAFTRHFGGAATEHAMFLLGSITKPLCVTALMTLFDRGEFRLEDRLQRFLPKFTGDGREQVTMQHLLTHVSGLPDQLAENASLRASHAGMPAFVEAALRTPLQFTPGSRYQYSSMGILLAVEVGRRITGETFPALVDRTVLAPLGMKHSALGVGRFALDDFVPCQTEHGAPEAGAGDPSARNWDWNSPYWRKLGAPWGGAHASAADVGRFLAEFLHRRGVVVKPETAQRMTANQNPAGLTPRGLGFNVGAAAGSPGCSERTFGHTGSTGTLAWADPATGTICVVLTSLPGRAVQPHPRELASGHVAGAVQ